MVSPSDGLAWAVRRFLVVDRFLLVVRFEGRELLELRVLEDRFVGARPREDFARELVDRVERFEDFDEVATVAQP